MSNSLQPMDCSWLGSSVHGISQASILEWVAIPSPVDLPDPGFKLNCRQILYQLSYQGSPDHNVVFSNFTE